MSNVRLRPRYQFHSPLAENDLYQLIIKALEEQSSMALPWRTVSGHIVINVAPEQRHFWSPHLDVNLEPQPQGGTTVRVLVGPAPAVWTLFMFFYALCILGFLGGLILGYSQYILQKPVTWFWLVPASVLLAGALWGIGLIGKKTGRAQTQQLLRFLEKPLNYRFIPEA